MDLQKEEDREDEEEGAKENREEDDEQPRGDWAGQGVLACVQVRPG